MNSKTLTAALVLLPVLAISCDREPEQPKSTTAAAPAPFTMPGAPQGATPGAMPATGTAGLATPDVPTVVTSNSVNIGGYGFTIPEGWKNVPPANAMRLAELQVLGTAGDPASLCVVAFSVAGGDIQANIARWSGQVLDAAGQPTPATPNTRAISGVNVTTVEMTGAYAGMDGTPKPNTTFRAAIIETTQGQVFIRMTGPADAMKTTAPGWTALLDSLKKP